MCNAIWLLFGLVGMDNMVVKSGLRQEKRMTLALTSNLSLLRTDERHRQTKKKKHNKALNILIRKLLHS